MIKFYGLDYTYYDHPGKYSLILYTNGCNLKCFGCHNRTLAGWDYQNQKAEVDSKKEIICSSKYHKELTDEEIKLAVQNSMIDMVILCGGEFLLHSMEDITKAIEYIKNLNSNVLIRIDTNGTFPEKVNYIKKNQLIDGFAIDIKGPYWDSQYHDIVSQIIGLPPKFAKLLFPKMVESLNIAKEMDHTIYRTVAYPIIQDDAYFDEIKTYVEKNLNKKQYTINSYIDL